jgi:hypothetical protein
MKNVTVVRKGKVISSREPNLELLADPISNSEDYVIIKTREGKVNISVSDPAFAYYNIEIDEILNLDKIKKILKVPIVGMINAIHSISKI